MQEHRPIDIPAYAHPRRGMDLESRKLYIPTGYISSRMISYIFKSTDRGVYGTAKYGRSRYSSRPGIYGYDKYGGCTYI